MRRTTAKRGNRTIFSKFCRQKPRTKNLPFFYIDCGTEDFLIQANREFNLLLAEKKIPHEYRELPGGHNWNYWDTQVQEFLRVSEKFIQPAKAKGN